MASPASVETNMPANEWFFFRFYRIVAYLIRAIFTYNTTAVVVSADSAATRLSFQLAQAQRSAQCLGLPPAQYIDVYLDDDKNNIYAGPGARFLFYFIFSDSSDQDGFLNMDYVRNNQEKAVSKTDTPVTFRRLCDLALTLICSQDHAKIPDDVIYVARMGDTTSFDLMGVAQFFVRLDTGTNGGLTLIIEKRYRGAAAWFKDHNQRVCAQ